MKHFLFSVVFVFSSLLGIGQVNPTKPDSLSSDSTLFTFSETMPKFIAEGGLQNYLRENVRYPKEEKIRGIQGTVYVSFVVEKNGSISNVHIKKEVPNAPGFSEEALRVIKAMPNWKPGTLNGHPARVEMTQPIRFVLEQKVKKKKH